MNRLEDGSKLLGESLEPVRVFLKESGVEKPDLETADIAAYSWGLLDTLRGILPGTRVGLSAFKLENLPPLVLFHAVCPQTGSDEEQISRIRDMQQSRDSLFSYNPTVSILYKHLEPISQFPEDDPTYLGEVALTGEDIKRKEHMKSVLNTLMRIGEASSGLSENIADVINNVLFGLAYKSTEEHDRALQEVKSRSRQLLVPFLKELE